VKSLDDKLVPYTPESRTQLTQAENDVSRSHALLMEWKRVRIILSDIDDHGREHVLASLTRWLAEVRGPRDTKQWPILDERRLRAVFAHLFTHATTPAVKQNVVKWVMDWAYRTTPDRP